MNFTSESINYTLTHDQQEALEMMLHMHDVFILSGPAGTGKSLLLRHFINERRKTGAKIVVTAPTHKAVSVVNGDKTIHSYLGLKLKYIEDRQVLVKSSNPFDSASCYGDILIVDESSMLSKEITKYIFEEQENMRLKIIFCLDCQQIPPINEKISPVCTIEAPKYALTEVVRQARDSGIIKIATAVRTGLIAPGECYKKYINNEDVLSGNMNQMKKFFCDCLDDGSVPTIISHKNKIVDSANIWARNIVLDNPKDRFLIDEKVYIRSTNEKQKHKLEDIVKIIDIYEESIYNEVKVKYSFNILRILVESFKGIEKLIIPASDKDSQLIQENKKELAFKARKRVIPWYIFWDFCNSLCDVKYIYAMTAHRSQGSTYENVIVNYNDINDKKILYTAITRPSKKLFLME